MSPMERGRFRYKLKDYEGALKAFNEVCTITAISDVAFPDDLGGYGKRFLLSLTFPLHPLVV